ncbi:hypothetical protein [Natrinema ejinorense]|uniref:Uncharacterized protein n=1 Tax=Natrinema ejinorense TaxID=373386 RepID=A0A2A5QP67_9EURY|nr:hypothetical protein [Natrinema ejinorense]PCR88648.1 hypothetical protein CP557_21695 [Natrinema ejinorense]
MSSTDELSETDVATIAWLAFGVGFVAATRSRTWRRGLLVGVCALPVAMFGGGMLTAALENMGDSHE